MEYLIKITQQESVTILQALGELPLKASLYIFGSIQRQIQEQDTKNAIPMEELEEKIKKAVEG